MRTGSGKRSNYNRTTGSKTGRLYSRRTAKKINKIYLNEEAKIIRTEEYYGNSQDMSRSYTPDEYDDYYDNPSADKKSGITTIILTASVIIAVLALVIVGLALMKPKDTRIDQLKVTHSSEEPTSQKETFGDSASPEIYGVIPIVVYEGHSVAYKAGVYVTDDNDPSPTLEIDNAEVNLSAQGIYPVSYIAKDKDGNVTREVTTVTVLAGKNLVSEDDIYALADKVLETVIPDESISDEMKCLKVYEYLHAIGYIDEVHSEDWMQNAYWMLTKREGDCFCYYSASRLLLTRLGYDVMEVRNNNNYVHYWCLVSIDGGNTWWHFDPCCWSWGEDGVLCLVSDNYLATFTRRHRTSDGRLIHAWDLTNYPSTPAEDFWTEEDRAVIYEGGLIDVNVQYDPNDTRWDNQGWENYQVPNYTEYYDYSYADDYANYGYGEDDYGEDDYTEDDYYEDDYTEDDYYEDDYTEDDYYEDDYIEEEYYEEEYYEENYAEDDYSGDDGGGIDYADEIEEIDY